RVEVLRIDILKYLGGEEGAGLFGLSSTSTAFFIWIVILMIYVYIASTLPVWSLLQPRDFINSHQLLLGLIILYIGLFVTNPKVTAPVTHAATDKSWLPLLLITIVCVAISRFHCLMFFCFISCFVLSTFCSLFFFFDGSSFI